jgi:ABC-type branched-subunit amino acid transport system substrate-binding protein
VRFGRFPVAVLVVAVLGSGLAACSSSSGGSSNGSTGSPNPPGSTSSGPSYTQPSGSVRGFDGTTIKVASLGIKAQLSGVDIGARARIQRFNKTNEIPGVKIQYLEYADDNNDRATALSESRRLVAQEQAFAVVGDTSAVNPVAYFQQQHVPYFGFAFDDTYCSAQPTTGLWGFGIDGCLIPTSPKLVPAGAAVNNYKYVSKTTAKAHPSVAIFSADNPSGQNAAKFSRPSYGGAGFKVVMAQGIIPSSAPVSDYTPYVQQLLHSASGSAPDSVVCLLTTDCIPVYTQLRANGYKGVYLSALYSDLVLAPMKGSAVYTVFAPFADPTPANQQLASDLQAVQAGKVPDLGSGVGYFSAEMFIQALKSLVQAKGKAFISPENVQQAAAHMTYEIKGQIGPTRYPASTVMPTPACSAVVADNDGKHWTTSAPYACSDKTFPVSP